MEMSSTASGDPDVTVNWGSIGQQYMCLSDIHSYTWADKFPNEYERLLLLAAV